ncbi:MAG: TIGR03936 family radical SAM-associated protein [Ruminococcus sp.]|nr:TIGR03936 family radical SAM-associated protein [Ruminococcus sp.]
MPQTEKIKYCLTFEKKGVAAYTSHLDVVRVFSRAFARSKLPIYYTEGFTRRPYLVFPYPLPLGVIGENEVLEFALLDEIRDVNDFMDKINAVLPNGLRVLCVTSDELPAVSFAVYEITCFTNNNTSEYERFFKQETIKAEKFSKKKGKIAIDLKPVIKENNVLSDGTITITLPVGENNNVNVNVFINALADFLGLKPEIFCAKRIKYLP